MLCNFEIVDNMGNVSYVDWEYGYKISSSNSFIYPIKGYNLFAFFSEKYLIPINYKHNTRPLINLGCDEGGDGFFLIRIPAYIHKNDIDKYSKFEIRERTNPIVFFKD